LAEEGDAGETVAQVHHVEVHCAWHEGVGEEEREGSRKGGEGGRVGGWEGGKGWMDEEREDEGSERDGRREREARRISSSARARSRPHELADRTHK